MLAPHYAVTASPTDRVEIVVLRVALAAEPCIRVPASRASVAVSIPRASGPQVQPVSSFCVSLSMC